MREPGIQEGCALEVRASELRALEVGVLEVGVCEVGAREIGTLEVGAPEADERNGGREQDLARPASAPAHRPAMFGCYRVSFAHRRHDAAMFLDAGTSSRLKAIAAGVDRVRNPVLAKSFCSNPRPSTRCGRWSGGAGPAAKRGRRAALPAAIGSKRDAHPNRRHRHGLPCDRISWIWRMKASQFGTSTINLSRLYKTRERDGFHMREGAIIPVSVLVPT